MNRWPLTALALCLAMSWACGGDDKPATPTTPTIPSGPSAPASVTGLELSGLPTTPVGIGQTLYLKARQRMSDGTWQTASSGLIWSTSTPEIATLSTSGVLTATASGEARVTVRWMTYEASGAVKVAESWAGDSDFRVAILNASGSPKPVEDVTRIFLKANDIMVERTGARLRLVDMREIGPGHPANLARAYLDSYSGEQPDGLLIWQEDETAISFGGYSTSITRPAPFVNRFPAAGSTNRIYLTNVHYDHKYGRCGYDTTGRTRISDRSGNGECRGRSGMTCTNNGRFWECPDVRDHWYAQPDVFTASTIVHEFLHPFGPAGNNDHYGTATCVNRVGMSTADAADLGRAQWHCGMCPDLFTLFRPASVPAMSRLRR